MMRNQFGNQMGRRGRDVDEEQDRQDAMMSNQRARNDRSFKPYSFGTLTITVKDPQRAAEFAVKYLGCRRLQSKNRKEATVCIDKNGNNQSCTGKLILKQFSGKDQEFQAFKEFNKDGLRVRKDGSGMKPRISWDVLSLNNIVRMVQQDNKRFLGPFRDNQGKWKLFVELPLHHWIQINSYKFDRKILRKENRSFGGGRRFDRRSGDDDFEGFNDREDTIDNIRAQLDEAEERRRDRRERGSGRDRMNRQGGMSGQRGGGQFSMGGGRMGGGQMGGGQMGGGCGQMGGGNMRMMGMGMN